jgi:hypothetical protein
MISQMTENQHVQRRIEQIAQKNPPASPSPETRQQKQRQDSLTRPIINKEKQPDLAEPESI